MSKPTKKKLIRAFNKLLKEKHQLEREKAWLIQQINRFTYGGDRISPPGYPFSFWKEVTTLTCLLEKERKNFKTELALQWEKVMVLP